jgi:hypothetical protein
MVGKQRQVFATGVSPPAARHFDGSGWPGHWISGPLLSLAHAHEMLVQNWNLNPTCGPLVSMSYLNRLKPLPVS